MKNNNKYLHSQPHYINNIFFTNAKALTQRLEGQKIFLKFHMQLQLCYLQEPTKH